MKKTSLLLLSSSMLMLLSCGGGGSQTIPEGKKVQKEDLAIHYAAAKENTDKVDALSVAVKGGFLFENYSKATMGETSQEIGGKIEVKDFYLNAGIKNFREDVTKFQTSLTFGAGFEYRNGIGDNAVSATANIKKAGFYIEDGMGYMDMESVRPIIQSLLPTAELPSTLHFKNPAEIPADVAKILDIDGMLAQLETNFTANVDYLDCGKGNYSFVYNLDPTKIIGETESASVEAKGSAAFAVSFSDEGFTSLGLFADFEASVKADAATGDMVVKSETTVKLKVDLKADFAYGDKAVIESVPNPESFPDLPE